MAVEKSREIDAAIARADPQRRVGSLDGLRGWAALIVVLNHVFIASFNWYVPGGASQPRGSWRWWITQTPLHVFWAGPEMVLVFFVLSGYVLALPAVARGTEWFKVSYYPRRLVRLYLPAWAAILFAAALHHFPAHQAIAGTSGWLNQFAVPVTLNAGVHAATLVDGGQYLTPFTTALWSMKWEVIFSMLLPFVVGATVVARRSVLAVIGAGVSLWVIQRFPPYGTASQQAAHYLPMFVLGSLLAFNAPRPPTPADAGRAARGLRWLRSIPLPLVCIALITTAAWHSRSDSGTATGWPMLAIALGACLAVYLAIANPLVVAAMSSRVSQWLGHRSYSLYLIHQPIVVAIAFAFHGHAKPLVLAVLAVPAALVAADLLWRLAERPAILLSRRTAVAVDALVGRLARGAYRTER